MKIIITGATGFLGSHLVKALLNEGHQVIILKRSFSDTHRISEVLDQVIAYDIDCSDLETPFQENGKIDAIFHAATCYGRTNESVVDIFEANTAFPLKLLQTAVAFNTDTFFNTDTILNKYLNSYSLSKRQFLEWGKQFSMMQKIRFVNIKSEHMYGPGDDESKFSTYVIKNCLNNVPELKLTPGAQKRDFIYIDDVVSAYVLLADQINTNKELFQEFELGSGKSISIREFVELVHQITQSHTFLNFGAFTYRENEIMESTANICPLQDLGWRCKVDLKEGIENIVEGEKI